MLEIIKLFLDICLFKKGPEDIPHSLWLLQLAIICYSGIGFLVLYHATDLFSAIMQLSAEIMLVLIFAWGLLQLFEKTSRYYQTASALIGTDALISFCALPMMIALSTQEWSEIAIILLLLMMFWHLLVTGHIISHALSKPFWFGVLVAFCYITFSLRFITMLFPSPENIV